MRCYSCPGDLCSSSVFVVLVVVVEVGMLNMNDGDKEAGGGVVLNVKAGAKLKDSVASDESVSSNMLAMMALLNAGEEAEAGTKLPPKVKVGGAVAVAGTVGIIGVVANVGVVLGGAEKMVGRGGVGVGANDVPGA